MQRILWLTFVAGAAALGGATLASCSQVDCGDGTINRNGECVATTGTDNGLCGAGTQLGSDGTCVPSTKPTVCDPDTTVEEVDPATGLTVCVGTGGGGCNSSIACPTPTISGRVTICGQLYDIEDDTIISDNPQPADIHECAGTETTGVCALQVQFYDAVAFANDPSQATPLPSDPVYLDNCGRFRASNLTFPSMPFVGIGADDNASAADDHPLTGVAVPVTMGGVVKGVQGYVVRRTTDGLWSTSAGNLSPSFATRGVYMALFRYKNMPVSGVTVTRSSQSVPSDDYYFSDTETNKRTTVVADGPTGPNGAALVLNSGLAYHSGTGGAIPGTCKWPSDLGKSIPGVVYVQTRNAVLTSDVSKLCP